MDPRHKAQDDGQNVASDDAQLATGLGEGSNRPVDLVKRMRRRHLGADARLPAALAPTLWWLWGDAPALALLALALGGLMLRRGRIRRALPGARNP